jgi:pyridoxamine 5'-phosphate oxidase
MSALDSAFDVRPSIPEVADPIALAAEWLAAARDSEPNDAEAMALATVDADGTPSVRMVLLKGIDPPGTPGRGFVFYTNEGSRKGAALAAHPRAALLLHWKSLRRQIRIEGAVSRVSQTEADAYFASRARISQLGAHASEQSRPLADRHVLADRLRAVEARFPDAVPRPAHWPGFRVTPSRIEFWQDMPYRLHDRLVFTAQPEGGWHTGRLYP